MLYEGVASMQAELLKKLKYKTGRALVRNAPEGFRLGIEEAADAAAEGEYDFALLFARDAEQAKEWGPATIPLLKDDAVFWIAYPKQSGKIKSDIHRDSLWKLMSELTAYRAVSNVAIDETWSAVRFRHEDKVKK